MTLPRCELLHCPPEHDAGRPPLLFVHGAMQGAWAWHKHWLPAAAAQGWPAYALSLRGHGESEGRGQIHRWRLRDYRDDICRAAQSLPQPPVLVGHSMGGLLVQQCLARLAAPAAVLVAPVSPFGGYGIAWQIFRRNPWDLLRLALPWGTSPLRSRRYGFGAHVPDLVVEETRRLLVPESRVAQYEIVMPRRPRPAAQPVLVIGAGQDQLISRRAIARTARAYNTAPVVFDQMGHNLMLEPGWQEPLQAMLQWLAGALRGEARTAGSAADQSSASGQNCATGQNPIPRPSPVA